MNVMRTDELYFECTSVSANGALASGGAGGGGVGADDVLGGSVSSTQVTGRSGFGVRWSSSNIRSTRAARSSSEVKYSMWQSLRVVDGGMLLNFGHRRLRYDWRGIAMLQSVVAEALCADGVRQRLERRDGRVEGVDRERPQVDVVEVIDRGVELTEVSRGLGAVLMPA